MRLMWEVRLPGPDAEIEREEKLLVARLSCTRRGGGGEGFLRFKELETKPGQNRAAEGGAVVLRLLAQE